MVEQDGFLSDYLTSSLIEAGASIAGPARSVEQANSMLGTFTAMPDAIVFDAQIYESKDFTGRDAISAAGIPLLLVTRGGYTPVFATSDTLQAPFAAYQVVDHIKAVVSQSNRSHSTSPL